MTARQESRALLAIVVLALALFSYYSFITPLFEASDELWHYPLVQYLATTGSLPVQQRGQSDEAAPWRQEGSQPPLYYAIAAIATAPFDTSNWRELRKLNPHGDLGKPTRDGNSNAVMHTAAEQFPWTRAALAIHVARLVSVLMSTLTVLFAYLVARELFPPRSNLNTETASPDTALDDTKDVRAWLRLGTAALTASVPMFAFISGSVNNDNAAALFSTMGLWYALRLMRRNDIGLRTAVISGVITAAATLSKSSTLGILGVFGLAAMVAARRLYCGPHKHLMKVVLRRLAAYTIILILVFTALAGWWFVRNQQLYGDLFGWNAFLDVVGRRPQPATLAQLWSEREGFVWAYWGVFGTLNVIMPPAVYSILNGMVAVSIVGWLLSLAWPHLRNLRPIPSATAQGQFAGDQRTSAIDRFAAPALSAIWVLVTFIAFLRWTSLTPASQGRLLFPCIAVISAAIAYGLYRIHRSVLWVACAGMAALAVSMPAAVIAPAYAQPPMLAQVTPQENLNTTFKGGLRLLGYSVPDSKVTPGGEITLRLYWQAQHALARDYSVFVHLLSEDGVVIGQRDMYPGQGSLATSQLKPGYTWSDTYVVPVSPLALAPQALHWAVGVYDLKTGARLSITQGTETIQGVEFGKATLDAPVSPPALLLDYGNGINLAQYDVQPRLLLPGQPVTVTLVWRAAGQITDDYIVSLQLLDDKANKYAQSDSAPVNGNAPTSAWQPGSTITDTHVLQINPQTPPGVYKLQLVLYKPAGFARLGAYGANGQYIDDQVVLLSLRVK